MRPSTTAAVLDTVADWMDVADQTFATVYAMQGRRYEGGKSVQGDLRMLAAWLREHPDTDQRMHGALKAVDAL